MKFCKDCKHCLVGEYTYFCKAKVLNTDLVTGDITYATARDMRTSKNWDDSVCGTDANLFEPIPEIKPISFWKCLRSDRTRRTDRTGPGSR